MHRIAVGGGVMGALFAIGAVVIVVFGVPVSRWFLLASLFFGMGVAVWLYIWHKRHPVELTGLQQPPSKPASEDKSR